jgi:ribonuclease HI
MAKPKKKYYTVWKGHRTGVFETWDDCKSQIANFEGAQYKSFPTFELAKTALKGNYKDYIGNNKKFSSALSETRLKLIGQPNYNSIAVDAASSGNPGIMEYRGVDTQSKKELFRKGPYQQGTNNVGEFLALVHGLAFLKQNNSDRILYTDSKTPNCNVLQPMQLYLLLWIELFCGYQITLTQPLLSNGKPRLGAKFLPILDVNKLSH